MPKFPLIVASITALLTFAASAPASAQSQSNKPVHSRCASAAKEAGRPKPTSRDKLTLSRRLRISRQPNRLPRKTTIPSLRTSPNRRLRRQRGHRIPAIPLIPMPRPLNIPLRPIIRSRSRNPGMPRRRPATIRLRPRSRISLQDSVQANPIPVPIRWPIHRGPKKTPRWVAFT